MNHKLHLQAIRHLMNKQGIDAYIIPSTDPHQSEYVADYWKSREWISGFDGSAGTVVITAQFAGLWTDSRYFLQAEKQLKNSGFELCKLSVPHTPEYIQWILENLPENSMVGFDGELFAAADVLKMSEQFNTKNINIKPDIDFIAPIWENRPALPSNIIIEHELEFAGVSKLDKLEKIKAEISSHHADYFVFSLLDEIAWLLNLRGADVKYNPVFVSYLIIGKTKSFLFVQPSKLSDSITAQLQKLEFEIKDYSAVLAFLNELADKTILYNSSLNYKLFAALAQNNKAIEAKPIVTHLKAKKNPTEQQFIRKAMVKDGVALTQFFMWLENTIGNEKITEISAGQKLYEFRKCQPLFMGESFGSISGYADHGAIVHYSASPETEYQLGTDSVFLLDSGAQYADGTTDITRTVHLGQPTEQQKTDFTLVLKGHIALASAKFPEGTTGGHLDALARIPLWQHLKNYGHGTGHGVGFFLNVHEGPQRISPAGFSTPLTEGMLISNEPGFYKTGDYGIRIENLVLVKKTEENEFGKFLEFETVTLFPIEKNLIAFHLLNASEIQWLDDYHRKVFEALSPFLNPHEMAWLKHKTLPIRTPAN